MSQQGEVALLACDRLGGAGVPGIAHGCIDESLMVDIEARSSLLALLRNTIPHHSYLGHLLVFVFLSSFSASALCSEGIIEGTVYDPTGVPQPGVMVALYSSGTPTPRASRTDESGEFVFKNLPPAIYTPIAALAGFKEFIHSPVNLKSGETIQISMNLRLAVSEEVRVQEAPLDDVTSPVSEQEISSNILEVLPLPADRFQEALPLLPGVVRGRRGRLNFNGARSAQSMLLVNGSNATDPLTGEFAFELPLKAVDSVEVYTIPYSAEFGSVTAAVANVVTRAGGDEWDVDFGALFPSLRWRDGKIQGINSWTPRVQVSGPLRKGKAWISQGVAYRFVRSRVREDVVGSDEEIVENVDSFTQFDWKINDVHSLTTTFSYFPVEIDNWGLSVLQPETATPEFHASGWNLAIAERAATNSNTLWETLFAVKNYDVRVTPQGEGDSLLTVNGLRENYFNEIDRDSLLFEFKNSCTHFIPSRHGHHVLKVGSNISYASFSGIDRSGVIETRGTDGNLLRTTDFTGSPQVGASDWVVAGYVQDQWRPTSRLGIDAGLRYDYNRITGSQHFAPRFAVAYSPWEEGRTILKGGWGVFFDHVFLHAGDFESLQTRVETEFGLDEEPVGPPLVFRNVTDPDLDVPVSTTWNLELNHQFGEDWLVRVKYQERRGNDEMVVDRLEEAPEGPMLLLSSNGNSNTKEFDVTVRKNLSSGGQLFLSYVRSRTSGDLNNFETLYRDRRSPVLLDNEFSLQPFDVPHRFLLWGVVELPHDVFLTPGFEWRSGFPYTTFTPDYGVVGERNRGGRFPSFFSFDIRVMKQLTFHRKTFRVGFQVFNTTSHFNPRDVYSNIGSPFFGEFADSVPLSAGMRFGFDF